MLAAPLAAATPITTAAARYPGRPRRLPRPTSPHPTPPHLAAAGCAYRRSAGASAQPARLPGRHCGRTCATPATARGWGSWWSGCAGACALQAAGAWGAGGAQGGAGGSEAAQRARGGQHACCSTIAAVGWACTALIDLGALRPSLRLLGGRAGAQRCTPAHNSALTLGSLPAGAQRSSLCWRCPSMSPGGTRWRRCGWPPQRCRPLSLTGRRTWAWVSLRRQGRRNPVALHMHMLCTCTCSAHARAARLLEHEGMRA